MVDVNPNASSLQAQLQAQLQAGRTNARPQSSVDLTPRPGDMIKDRLKTQGDEAGATGNNNRQLPVKLPPRLQELSSSAELAQAEERVTQATANTREAPIGRTSVRESELRNQPLGQIIDIRV